MIRYSTEPNNQLFVKGCGFLSFAKNMSRNTGEKLSGTYSQKRLNHAKQPAKDAFKSALKKAIQKKVI